LCVPKSAPRNSLQSSRIGINKNCWLDFQEVKEWKRCLGWEETVVPALEMARPWGSPRLVLQSEEPSLNSSISTTSLYENVSSSQTVRSYRVVTIWPVFI
jgi:hypothetical protein